MSAQECILVAGSIVFILALLPAIFNPDGKPDATTSAMTGIVLFVFACTYFTLELPFVAITSLITSIMWGVLFAQKKLQNWNK